MKKTTPPAVSVIGRSDAGKTTLISCLTPLLKERGYKIAAVKHALHGFDMDKPGKDTFRIREAGAEAVAVVSGQRVAIIRETMGEMPLERIVGTHFQDMDLVLVEGYKKLDLPKVEVLAPGRQDPPLDEPGPEILYVIRPWGKDVNGHLCFNEEDLLALADLIENRFIKAKP